MVHFAQAQYLFLILFIPFFFLLYWWMLRLRRRRVKRFGNPELVEVLTPQRSKRKGWVKLTFYSIAFFFFCVGLARPQIGATLKEQEVKGAEIMIALDVSNSMLAEDYYPNRLERAKLAISKLVDRLKDDRIGLVVFAGQSFVQLPITTDYVSAKIFLNTINTESIPVQGTALGDAIITCVKSFSLESENSRAIILITDGENHEDDPISAAKDATSMGAKVFCVGVGSTEGKPIPKDGELMKDKDGNIVVTRLDEETLREVALAGNGMYIRAGASEFGLNPIIDEIKSLEEKRYQSVVFEEYDEQFMYFFGIALFFLVLEFLINNRKNRKKLFVENSFVNNKTVSVVLLLFLSIATFGQTDKKEVRAGNRAYKDGNYQKAEVDYKRGLLKDSTSLAAHYNLGNTYFKTENFEEATKHLSAIKDTLTKDVGTRSADYFHNVGNVALKQKKYQEAVDAFKESLRRRPTDFETKSNLAYAQKMLENQQQQQQQNQNQDQNQDQQNQDQQNQDNQNNQDKNQNQNPDQNKDQNQDQSPNEQQQQAPPKITPQAAQQMLQAIEDKEKQTQDKVNKEKAEKLKSKQKDKNW